MTTPDYSTLDTAALVAAAETLTAGIGDKQWSWEELDHRYGFIGVNGRISREVAYKRADAAFIAAAPALVKALVARLRECENG